MGFPPDFLFGTANADHQVEAHDPQREDVWDLWERVRGLTPRGRATDFWNRYEEDIAAAAAIGLKVFRFSVAWARVEPEPGRFDGKALAHYREVADCVHRHGMQAMVTLQHFVWPVWLERDFGGMIGAEFPDRFTRYARAVAGALGERVDWWITFNEPSQLTFGYIRPWWQSWYYMPPGLPRGSQVDAEAEAVGKLVPNLFRAHARARAAIRELRPVAKVGVNPLVTGFPSWLQMIMDWGACHRGLQEALFKFTTQGALVTEHGKVDLVIGGISRGDRTRHEFSDPYLRTSRAVLVGEDFPGDTLEALGGRRVGMVATDGREPDWRRDLPHSVKRQLFRNYDEARRALRAGRVDALYGDAFFLLPPGSEPRGLRFLVQQLGDEHYVVAAAHGHTRLMALVDRAIAGLARETGHEVADVEVEPPRPASLHDHFRGESSLPERLRGGRGLRRVRKRGKLRVGLRVDSPGVSQEGPDEGLELRLARRIAAEVLGDESKLVIVPLEPAKRLTVIESKTSWLNWAWRFWGTTSLIANANWWYLGTSGKLPEELCPREAVGAQDFVGLDYYWGLPTRRLYQFRLLEEAAHGRFLRAPVWPRGLYHALRRFGRWFPEQELIVVENGCTPSADGVTRGEYLERHLAEAERALAAGVKLRGYLWWSITSNREWGHAFDPNTDFGLYFVDLDKDPELKRKATPEVERWRKRLRGG